MKVFVSHSNNFDFTNELYVPLRNSELNKTHEIFLPHEHGKIVETKEIIKNSDIILAEVSYPSTGQGIELGWANVFNIPIICFSKKGTKISGSLLYLTNTFFEYETSEDMIEKIKTNLSQ